MQVKLNGSTGWQSFVSLHWYDQVIEFLFRFVAKTSEPLLAIGLIISAADVLTKGRLMNDNVMLAYGWAWAQSIAIESSGGVVLVYGLQSFKDRDRVKAWAYIILAGLLAIVGGMMLYSQLLSSATGAQDAFSGGGWLTQVLVILRVIVSVTYVVLCRTKHFRFHDLLTDTAPGAVTPAQDDRFEQLLARMETMQQQSLQMVVEVATRVSVNAVREALTELPGPLQAQIEAPDSDCSGEQEGEQSGNYGARIDALYQTNPEITVSEIVNTVGCSRSTANKWLQRVKPEK